MEKIKDRLQVFLASKELTAKAFEEKCGLGNGTCAAISDKTRSTTFNRISKGFPELNIEWLKTGEGEMLKSDNSSFEIANTEDGASTPDYKLIPLINIDSVGGVHSENLLSTSEQFIERLIPFTGAKEGDKAIYHSGESMMPTIPPGSILQIRRVDDWQEYFGYGSTFVLWLRDDRRITKQIMRYPDEPDKYVMCHSHNPEYGDERLPKRLIQEVWKVIKVLTDKGW